MSDGAQFEEVIRVKMKVDASEIESAEARAARLQAEAKGPPGPRAGPQSRQNEQGGPGTPQQAGQAFARTALLEITRGITALSMGQSFRGIVAPRIFRQLLGTAGGWNTNTPRTFFGHRSAGRQPPTPGATPTTSIGGGGQARPPQPPAIPSPASPGGGKGPPPLPVSLQPAKPPPLPPTPGGPTAPPATPPGTPAASGGPPIGAAIAVTAILAGVALWRRAIISTADTYIKAARTMAGAADRVASGIVKANSSEILQGVLEGRTAAAYLAQGQYMLRYGMRGAAVGGAVGGAAGGAIGAAMGGGGGAAIGVASGGILGSGAGAALGVGYGFLKGLPDVVMSKIQSMLMAKLTSIMDSLVEQSRKYNGVAASWAARYEVAQIHFTMKLAKASEPLVAAWMSLKIRILEEVADALPKLKPLIDWLATRIDEMKGSMDKLPEQILYTAATFIDLAATTIELMESFKRLIGWVDEKVVQPTKAAVHLATDPAAQANLFKTMGVMGVVLASKLLLPAAKPGNITTPSGRDPSKQSPVQGAPPSQDSNKLPAPAQSGSSSIVAGLRMMAERFKDEAAKLSKSRVENETAGGKKKSEDPTTPQNPILFMRDFLAFDKLHRESFAKLMKTRGEEITRRQNAAREPLRTPKLPPMPGQRPVTDEPVSRRGQSGQRGTLRYLTDKSRKPASSGTMSEADQSLADQVNSLGGSMTERNNLLRAKIMLKNLKIYGTATPSPLSTLNAAARGNQMVGRSNEDLQKLHDEAKKDLYPTGKKDQPAPELKSPPWMTYADWAAKRGTTPLPPSAPKPPPATMPVTPKAATPIAPKSPAIPYNPREVTDGMTKHEDDANTDNDRYKLNPRRNRWGIGGQLDQRGMDNLRDAQDRDAEYQKQQDRKKQAGSRPATHPSTAPTTSKSSKPPVPKKEHQVTSPKPQPFPAAQLAQENNFEIRLQNARLMHDTIADLRDNLTEAGRKMENEVRLQVSVLDSMTLGGML